MIRSTTPFFATFKCYRKWLGGYWEKWYMEIGNCDMWFRWDSKKERSRDKERPDVLCRGTPVIEDYTE